MKSQHNDLMWRVWVWIAATACAFALVLPSAGCIEPLPPPIPPTPVFIEKNSDTAKVERGIRPAFGRDGIYLEWSRLVWRDLAGYRVFRSTDTLSGRPINFRLIREIPIGLQPDRSDTTFTDSQVGLDTTYYYQIAAYSRFNTQSNLSSPVFFRLTRRPNPEIPRNVIDFPTDSTLLFRWTKPNVSSGFYVLKLYEFNGSEDFIEEECVAVAYGKSSFVFIDTLRIDFGASPPPLVLDEGVRIFKRLQRRNYRWRVFVYPRGRERFFGAASEAMPFVVR